MFYILPILGTQLYNQIISQVGSNTVSAANVTLLDNYVVPCLMYYVKCELINFATETAKKPPPLKLATISAQAKPI